MFGHFNKTKPKPRYNITRDGHGDWRVEAVYLTERTYGGNVQTKESVRARLHFQNLVFGNQIQAEKAIMEFEEKEKLDVRQVVAQVF